ncbi:MAG: DNA translocase FtsK 4TM domain-containing protein, partial [Ulvibacter sp.]|nr:DNA translocase FtsK 4TM domain-containing protein [Ulvibacter sp.]
MAIKKTTRPKKTKQPRKPISFSLSKQQKILLGSFLTLLGIALLISFTSFLFTWQADQSIVGIANRNLETKNWLSTFGSNIAYICMYQGFGIAGYIFASLVTLTGVYLFFDFTKKRLLKFWFWGMLVMIWFSVFFAFFSGNNSILSGVIGFEI